MENFGMVFASLGYRPAKGRLLQRTKYITLIFLLFGKLGLCAKQNHKFDYLREVDFNHPLCESPIRLDIASEYFVEVQNEVLGAKEYNEMCHVYREQDWRRLDGLISQFAKIREHSPLAEAVSFLSIQSHLDRLGTGNEISLKDTELALREILILYPQSPFAPILYASLGNFWLQRSVFDKSLGFYELARKEYPFHSASCTFQMGVAENYFLLRNYRAAEASLKMLLQKCKNLRLRMGAELRLTDIRSANRRNPDPTDYAKIAASPHSTLIRYYPSLYYNLGEFNYQKQDYARAKYYFKEYLAHEHLDPNCAPHALKREADISFQLGEPLETTIGKYLIVWERAPDKNIGKLSYIHSLLLGLHEVGPPEQERRLRLIDEEAEKIDDNHLRSIAYLEKGLILLDKGEKSALNYLLRLGDRTPISLKRGKVASFVRDKLLHLLQIEAGFKGRLDSKTEGLSTKAEILNSIERAHATWLKGTPHGPQGVALYGKLIREHFRRLLQSDHPKEAFKTIDGWIDSEIGPSHLKLSQKVLSDFQQLIVAQYQTLLDKEQLENALNLLTHWHGSKLNPAKNIKKGMRDAIASRLVEILATDKNPKNVSDLLIKHKESIQYFVHSPFTVLWVGVSVEQNDFDELRRFLGGAGRAAAAKKKLKDQMVNLSDEMRSYIWYLTGRGLLSIDKGEQAEAALSKVTHQSIASRTLKAQLELYRKMAKYGLAYQVGSKLMFKEPAEQRSNQLAVLLDLAEQGKLWTKGSDLLRLSEKQGLTGKASAPYYYFAGKSSVETNQCKQAVPLLERALLLDPDDKQHFEARFKLGKCLSKLKQPGEARKIWTDLAALKDEFWSPLARNELSLLKK